MVTAAREEIICVVAGCIECGKAVIYKYVKNGNPQTGGYIPLSSGMVIPFSGISPAGYDYKPDPMWCECGSDEPRYLCKVGAFDTPGFLDKCESCKHKFICASSRIEVIYEGVR